MRAEAGDVRSWGQSRPRGYERQLPFLTDAVQTKFSKAADAFRAPRREGPHRVLTKRPRTFVSALQGIAAAE